MRKTMWQPRFGLTGPLRLTVLKNVAIQSAVGVGGGSLIYGNVLYEPPEQFYNDPQWATITDWKAELAPYYDQAKRMLGVATNPRLTPTDDVFKSIADDLGVADTFHPTQVGVFFGEPGKTVSDPYFGGIGPDRAGCVFCGRCINGCAHNAKNTLERNYLYLAEKAGVQVHPMTTVVDVRESPAGGYQVETVETGRWVRKRHRTWRADQVVFSAAALGTQNLLHRLRANGSLPRISARLGELTRTNSEVGLIATSRTRTDLAQGVAGTSSIHPDANTHIEAFRLGKGSNWGFLLTTTLVDGDRHRLAKWVLTNLRHPAAFARSFNLRRASERTISLLVMQDLNNSLTTYLKRGLFGTKMTTRQGVGAPNPNWIPVGNDVADVPPQRSTVTPAAITSTSSTARPPRISSAVAPSEIRRPPASSTRTSGYTGIRACTSSMGRRSRPTWASTPPSPSPRCRNGRSRSGPTRANPTHVLHSAPPISGFRRSDRAVRSCPKARRRRFASPRLSPAAARIPVASPISRRRTSCGRYPAPMRWT